MSTKSNTINASAATTAQFKVKPFYPSGDKTSIGEIAGWNVVDSSGSTVGSFDTHEAALLERNRLNSFPRYYIKPFYGILPNGMKSEEPTGWDVWEDTSRSVGAVISPCDTREEAERELARIAQP